MLLADRFIRKARTMLPADYHMHTHNSGDSNAPMKDMVESSIQRGLKEICFTEHLDLDYPEFEGLPLGTFDLDYEAYRQEYLLYKEKYKDQIKINFGVEIGMQSHVAKENTAFVQNGSFDFVIASVHLVDRRDPFYDGFWDHAPVEDIFKRYFELTLENIKLFKDFDVLGHLDYIARYVPEGDRTYSYERFKDQIDEILVYLIQNDKGLDFNSKALGYIENLNPNPCPEALKRYYDLGGRIITFGSDAHTAEKVGIKFEKAVEIAKNCGFTEYYTFDKRKPIAHKL